MPENRDRTIHRMMVERLDRYGVELALKSEFVRAIWVTSNARQRAAVLTRHAWRARDLKVKTPVGGANSQAFAAELQQAARKAAQDAVPFEAVPEDLPPLGVQFEAAMLLLHAVPADDRNKVGAIDVPANATQAVGT